MSDILFTEHGQTLNGCLVTASQARAFVMGLHPVNVGRLLQACVELGDEQATETRLLLGLRSRKDVALSGLLLAVELYLKVKERMGGK